MTKLPDPQAADKRAAQARINGAQSKGPTSPEGKARSSLNALKHGFAAKINILIHPDDSPAWDRHLAGFRADYLPTNYVENDMVDELASLSWRKARLAGVESALYDFQLSVQEEKVDEYFPAEAGNPRLHLVLAWQALSRKPLPRWVPTDPNQPVDPTLPPDELDSTSLHLLQRYMTSLSRQFRTAQANLRQYRKDFAPPKPSLSPAIITTEEPPATVEPPPTPPPPTEPQPQGAVNGPDEIISAPNEPTKIAILTPKPPANPVPNAPKVAA